MRSTFQFLGLMCLLAVFGIAENAMAFGRAPEKPALFADFGELDQDGQTFLTHLSQGSWEKLRSIKVRPCDQCQENELQFADRLLLNATPTELSGQSSGGFGWRSSDSKFRTGENIGKLFLVGEKKSADGSIQVVYGVDPSTGIFNNPEANKMTIAILDPRFFTADPTSDAVNSLLEKQDLQSFVRFQYIVFDSNKNTPNLMTLQGYGDETKTPIKLDYSKTDPTSVSYPWGTKPWGTDPLAPH